MSYAIEAIFTFGEVIATERFADVAATCLDNKLIPLLRHSLRGGSSYVAIEETRLHIRFHIPDLVSYEQIIGAMHEGISTIKPFPLISEEWRFTE